MLIIFNKSGNEFSVDFQYDSFSQGDTNTHIVDVIVEDTTFSNYEYNAYVQFLREGEKEPSPKLIMATKRFNYNGNYYSGYTFKMESDWFTAIAGTLKMTIEIKKYSNGELQSNKAYGVVNIPVQPSVSSQADVDSAITDEEYTAMVQLINSKLNVDDYDIEKSWYDVEEDFADNCITEVMQENGKRKVFFTSIGDTPTRYEAIGLVNQQNGTYYCVVYSPTGTSLYKRTLSDDYVTKINYKTSTTIFETNNGTAPVHLKSSFPYVVSNTASKVGMRAYTEDGEYQGEIAGQFAVSYNEEYGGHFANMQARDNEGTLHTLRVSKMGATYHTDKNGVSQKHDLALDENVVHNTGAETINGDKTFYKPIVVRHLDEYYDQWSKTNIGQAYINLIYNNEIVNNGIYLICGAQDSLLMMRGQNGILNLYPEKFTHSQSKDGQLVKNITVSYPTESGTLATQEWAKNYVDVQIENLIDNAPETLNTFKEIADYIASDKTGASQMTASINKNRQDIANNTNQINALENNKLDKEDLVYENVENAPEKINIVVRDTISADTYNEAREIQIGSDKFKFGSGSKIKANEFVDGTLPTLEYLNIDGETYQLPNYVVEKSGLKLVSEGTLELNDEINDLPPYKTIYEFENNKFYLISIPDCSYMVYGFCLNDELVSTFSYENGGDNFLGVSFLRNYGLSCITIDGSIYRGFGGYSYKVYEIPLGESAQVEKHNKTINALMQRVSDLEQKAGLTSVGYVQDSTLNLIRVNVVDDVLEVSGFKFDGEVMII